MSGVSTRVISGVPRAVEGDGAGSREFKPYKGPDSYQDEDGDFFFGRDQESSQIMSLILSSRCTLFHAQSGAGKTSLLNARIIPGLAAEGTLPIRVLMQNDPLAAVRHATLQAAVLHPDLEQRAIERSLLALGSIGEDPTLQVILDRYDALDPADERSRTLATPLPSSLTVGGLPVADEALVTPFFSRLLRSTLTVERFSDQLAAVMPLSRPERSWVGPEMRLSALTSFLRDPEVTATHETLLEDLTPPVATLAGFFEQFCYVRSQHPGNLALVVVFDQFEELFTRFVDLGSTIGRDPSLPDWRLRWRFFEEFAELYRTRMVSEGEDTATRPSADSYLPIRFVFSMRDEYIGQLSPLREIVQDLDDRSYRLPLLEVARAREAIGHPARLYGYDYSPECYVEILGALTKEERFVEPSHIQIVCEKLWDKYGRGLASQSSDHVAKVELPIITLQQFRAMGGVKEILRSFFKDFIEDLDAQLDQEAGQLEALELLQGLITGAGTRNIVEERALLETPFRDAAPRRLVLSGLVDRRIVRIEPRLGGRFVEITHEFLIEPILEQIHRLLIPNAKHQGLMRACRILELGVQGEFRVNVNALLNSQQVESVHEHREEIRLTPAAAELMLRSIVVNAPDRAVLAAWLTRYEQLGSVVIDVDALLGQLADPERPTMIPGADEWRALNLVRARVAQSSLQKAMLRASLLWAGPDEREEVVYWTKRALANDQ